MSDSHFIMSKSHLSMSNSHLASQARAHVIQVCFLSALLTFQSVAAGEEMGYYE